MQTKLLVLVLYLLKFDGRIEKLLLLLMLSTSLFTFGQNIEVLDQGGNSSSYLLNNVEKITFSSGEMILTKEDESTSSYLISNLRRLSFDHLVTNQESSVGNDSEVLLYPNPVNNELNLAITEVCRVSILSLKGEVLIINEYSEKGEKTILLEGLPSGFYLCQYASEKEVKTVKIIKE